MKLKIDLDDYRVPDGKKPFKLHKMPTKVKDLYKDAAHYESLLGEFRQEINDLQQMMFAHNRYAMLFIFQAMDAAGKDGTIQHVMSGINPEGVEVQSFKQPSLAELDHDFLWRSTCKLPPRGRVGIFNRSYYEEVLVCKVHPSIILERQRLPASATKDMKKLFEKRYEDIANFEAYAHRNGIHVVKFMLHVSKAEQKKRFLERIDTPSKNWKFNAGDIEERPYWDKYMDAYEDAINATATEKCPWYVVPADDKKNMRLIVSAAILAELQTLELHWPRLPKDQRARLAKCKEDLLAEKD